VRPARWPRWAAALAAVVLLPSCTAAEVDDGPPPSPGVPTEPTEKPSPGPTTGQGPPAGAPALADAEVDPCLLPEEEVAEVVGVDLPQAGVSGGELFALCTYGGEEAPGTVDIALVDLDRVSEESQEEVDGDAYIEELASGVGTGTATPLPDLGDGRAVRLTYPFGSQAWAWVDDQVYGAYVSDLEEADALAEDVLRAVLDARASR
jgi:hypothetical protein